MKFILGKKIDMTQVWVDEDRKAVTRVQAGPVVISQLKTEDRDGYSAVQVGFGDKKAKNVSKSVLGHLKNLGAFRWLKEFRVEAEDLTTLKVGDKINVETFSVGDKVTVTGWSKGRGFTGVVKRHGFHGQDATHGNKDQLRMPGSIGSGGVQRVFKGIRMAGHMGDHRTSYHNVKVIQIDEVNNIIYLEGGVPGARGSLVLLTAQGDLRVVQNEVESEKFPPEADQTWAEKVESEEIAASAESSFELKKETEVTESPVAVEVETVENKTDEPKEKLTTNS